MSDPPKESDWDMGKSPDIATPETGSDTPIPSLEDVMKASNWDERLAQARLRREHVLGKNGPISRPPVPARTPALPDAVDDAAKAEPEDLEEAPSINEILTTANWSDRLEKAKERREEILAKRNAAQAKKIAAANETAKKQEKETIRLAVTGFRRDAPVSDDAPKETAKAAVFAPLPAAAAERATPTPELAANAPQTQRSKWPIAAGLALVAFAGAWAAKPMWMPSHVTLTEAALSPSPAEPQVVASPVPAVETAALPTTGNATAAQFEVAGVAPTALNLPTSDAATADAPLAVASLSPRVSTASALPALGREATPTVQTTSPVLRADQMTVAKADATAVTEAPLGVAPEYLDTVSTLAAVSEGLAGAGQTASESGIALSASATLQHSNLRPAMAPAPSEAVNASTAFQVPNQSLASLGNIPAVMPVFARAVENPNPTDFGAAFQPTSDQAQDNFEPTKITFLSGPALTDTPATAPSVLSQSPFAGTGDVSAALNVPEDFQALNASLPTPLTDAQRLASLGSIAEDLTQDAIATVPASPESFEDMVARVGVSPTIRATVPADNGLSLDVSAYSIHVQAPAGLSEDKLTQFSDALRHTGFVVKPPTRVSYKVSKNNIRYYHAEDADAAKVLAEAVDGTARDFTDFSPSPPLGTIEVFLAGNSPKTSKTPTKRRSSAPAADPEVTALRNRLLNSLRRGDHL
ncbi:MAG: hypothetical protein ACSHXD_09900 [Marinosulfonomonas sp.]